MLRSKFAAKLESSIGYVIMCGITHRTPGAGEN